MPSKIIALLTLCLFFLAGPGHALAEYACGQDLNGDGYADGEGETALCTQAGSSWFCPVGAVDCVARDSEPVCLNDGTLDTERDVCQTAPEWTCPTGFVDPGERCEKTPVCASGTYNPATDMCEVGNYACSVGGQTFTSLSVCQSSCEETATCEGSIFNASGGPVGVQSSNGRFTGDGNYLRFNNGSIYLGPGVNATGGGSYDKWNWSLLKLYGSGSNICATFKNYYELRGRK
jgi:conjugal transfer mating pair stabilization protein TraN